MIAALLLALLPLQERPVIESARTVTGGAARTGCWLPLRVTVRSAGPFDGTVTATADAAFSVTRPLRLPAGGSAAVILPIVALHRDARIEVSLRRGEDVIDRRHLQEPLQWIDRQDLLELVDRDHPEAPPRGGEAVPIMQDVRLWKFPCHPSEWLETAALGAFDSVDLYGGSEERRDDPALRIRRVLGDCEQGEPFVGKLLARFPCFEAVDSRLAALRSVAPWLERQRDAAIFFLIVYAFAVFVITFAAWSRRWGPWTLAACLAGVSIAFTAAFFAVFPRGDLALLVRQAVVESKEGSVVVHLVEVRSREAAPELRFARLAKPVRAEPPRGGSLELFLSEEGGCRVRGWTPDDPAQFLVYEFLRSPVRATADPVAAPEALAEYFGRLGARPLLCRPEDAASPPVSATGSVEVRTVAVVKLNIP